MQSQKLPRQRLCPEESSRLADELQAADGLLEFEDDGESLKTLSVLQGEAILLYLHQLST
jgi:hypothetical protein